MRFLIGLVVVVVIVAVAAISFGFVDINRTQEGKLPEIRAEGGQLPGYDVKTAKIEVGTTNTTVDVPTVGTRKETVQTPTVEVKKPN